MKIKKSGKGRLAPGRSVEFFKEHPDLYNDLREGKYVSIPSSHEDQIMRTFGISIITEEEGSKTAKTEDNEEDE